MPLVLIRQTRALSLSSYVFTAFMPALNRIRERWTRYLRSGRLVPEPTAHVAAVCYRVRGAEIEFLLVRSRAGRWTFPKGKVAGDRTRADAAAREAFEEAGVLGRVESRPFASYVHQKKSLLSKNVQHPVDAHLCEVKKVVTPLEGFRSPTWFSAQRSKKRLEKKRDRRHALELARIVDEASAAIAERHRIRYRVQ
jgi:8-oxo-dGTP pyrophosphatase MutT (NUDIX family)